MAKLPKPAKLLKPAKLPESLEFSRFDRWDLDPADANGTTARVRIRPETTDIFVFVHGWRNGPAQADAHARRLFAALDHPPGSAYPGLNEYRPQFIALRWPSTSGIRPASYRRIRDRAHAIGASGPGARALGSLLGYLDGARTRPSGPPTLRTAGGQYLHCIGHSFGCRLLGSAIMSAADSSSPPVLGWPWHSSRPFNVDSFVALQMAAPPTIFRDEFAALTGGDAPIAGPVVATFSRHDHALRNLHRIVEGTAGVGALGVLGAPTIPMHHVDQPYRAAEFSRITNVDASHIFRGGRPPAGAHARIWHRETAHLVLAVSALARE
jgi:hypothetical protein